MSIITTDNAYYSDIGNAIRSKLDTDQTYTPSEMGDAIRSISAVKGIKGDSETEYRTGYVSLSSEDIGALKKDATATSATKLASTFDVTINGVTKSTDGSSNIEYTSEELKIVKMELDQDNELLNLTI